MRLGDEIEAEHEYNFNADLPLLKSERRALSVHNLAFSPDGCSNVVKIVQLYRHRHPDHAILTTDVATAFQSAPRSQMERELYADADLTD